MKKHPLVLPSLLLAALAASACGGPAPAPADPGPKGHLFIVGGGDRDEPLMRRFVELAGANGPARVVVFTMASGVPHEVGPELVAEFRGYGVPEVAYHQLTRDEAMDPGSVRILDGATAVWFSGGDQSRLTAALLDTPIHARLIELYAAGGLVGGTSAGAAVMSKVMITGDEKRAGNKEGSWEAILADNVVHTRGFGFVRNVVVDQHFVTRRRHNRLISLVLENISLVGVGIEEATAVLVRPDGRYEVLGEGQVVVYDARRATPARLPDGHLGGRGLTMHVLVAGDVYDPVSGRAEGPSR